MQSRAASFIESCTSIGIGFVISLGVWLLIIKPLYGIEVDMLSNLEITGIFTVFSVARSYVVRRWFTGRKRR